MIRIGKACLAVRILLRLQLHTHTHTHTHRVGSLDVMRYNYLVIIPFFFFFLRMFSNAICHFAAAG